MSYRIHKSLGYGLDLKSLDYVVDPDQLRNAIHNEEIVKGYKVMNNSNQNKVVVANGSNGIGVLGLLGILFVALKLTGYIDWSWWLVLLPFYIGLVIFLTIFIVLIAIAILGTTRNNR